MRAVADGVRLLRSRLPIPYAINAYLVGDVLVDAAGRHDRGTLLSQLEGHAVSAHVLTHAHPDHQGSSHAICEELGIPLDAGARDADAAEDPALTYARQPAGALARAMGKLFIGPGHPVRRRLVEGDEVAGFAVLDTPGHSAGHISLWRETDRTLICGDVVTSHHPFLLLRGLREPPGTLTPDPELNRRSIGRLGELEPATVLPGHGPPVRDTRAFTDFCASVGRATSSD